MSVGGAWRVPKTNTGERLGDGPDDFGWIEINKELSEKISDVRFIPEERMNLNINKCQDRYFSIIGFPYSKNKKFSNRTKTGCWHYNSAGTKTDDPLFKEYTNHIFIPYNTKALENKDGSVILNPIKPRGISGGGIIDLGNFHLFRNKPYSKLSGITIELNKNLLIGLKLSRIVDDIKSTQYNFLNRANNHYSLYPLKI